jgi:hypothetical protein
VTPVPSSTRRLTVAVNALAGARLATTCLVPTTCLRKAVRRPKRTTSEPRRAGGSSAVTSSRRSPRQLRVRAKRIAGAFSCAAGAGAATAGDGGGAGAVAT